MRRAGIFRVRAHTRIFFNLLQMSLKENLTMQSEKFKEHAKKFFCKIGQFYKKFTSTFKIGGLTSTFLPI